MVNKGNINQIAPHPVTHPPRQNYHAKYAKF